jgi:hypothetical protein
MVTTYTKSVGAGDVTVTERDYTTITLAEADVLNIVTTGDLVSDDEEVVFELYDDGDFSESVTVSAVGVTTGVDNTVHFQAASGEKHTAVRNGGVKVNPSTGHAS